MALSCIACCNFHIISISFNCSDTALRVNEAMISLKVKIFVFHHVCSISRIWLQNLSVILILIFGLFSSRKRGWNFSYEPMAKFIPVTGPTRSTRLMWRERIRQKKARLILQSGIYNILANISEGTAFLLQSLTYDVHSRPTGSPLSD